MSATNDPCQFQFDLPPQPYPARELNEVIHKSAWRAAPLATSKREPGEIELIVIHATAGSSTEGAVSVMTEKRASFHWIVPGRKEAAHGRFVWACAPESRAAWHVHNRCFHPEICGGAKRLNHRSLGIEIVNDQRGEPFSPWQIEATAEIIAYAMGKYPALRHVTSHARLDPARRTDPGPLFPWTEFVDRITENMKRETLSEPREFHRPR
ncbi:N-acetylmuramoyl-L-alanine amidase [Hyphococcus sp. DH-69]|uniref:N-acetylmuramoyl-L-alanine amidase n=1 Tax=Hyphococcus formosus TaxID=3143534 RepID=UPI00398AAE96